MIGVAESGALPIASARSEGARDRTLLTSGIAMVLLFCALVVLWANFPAGYSAPWAPAPDSVAIFRAVWPYPSVPVRPGLFGPASLAIILGLWACYAVGARQLWTIRMAALARGTLGIVIGVGLAFNILLAVVFPPVFSSDLWDYSFEGRVVTHYHLDPYVVTAKDLNDPLIPLMGWPDWPLRYAPVAPLLGAGVTALAGQNLFATALGFKGMAVLFSLMAAGLIFLITRRLNGESGTLPLMLYLWNPLLLLEIAWSGHNDVIMLALGLLGLWLVIVGWRLPGIAALVLSFNVKYVTAILILFVVAHELLEARSWRQGIARAVEMAAVGIVFLILPYLPFGGGLRPLRRLLLSAPSAGNADHNVLTTIPRDWIVAAWRLAGTAVRPRAVELDIGRFWQIAFVVLVLILLYHMARGKRSWPEVIFYAAAAILFYLVLVFAGNYPWYLIVPLGLALAGPRGRANTWLVCACEFLALASMATTYSLFLGP